MKKSNLLKIFASALAVLSLSVAASAKGFTKTQEYPDGKFTDVPTTQWYASEVKSAFELGLMNGQSDTTFAPDGNVTVAEGITMASRVHSIYNGKTIAEKSGGKWYDMYVSYALENGLIKDGQFADYDRNIMRYEVAVMFANAMPAEYFAKKNNIKGIPDVAKSEEYYDELMMLYEAGVVLGSDDYGNFYPTNPIKRSEIAAIINRVALPENRKEGTLKEYDGGQAVFLIDDHSMFRTVSDKKYVASGWRYENLIDDAIKEDDSSNNVLVDSSKEGSVSIHRDVTTQTKGVVKVETKYTLSGKGICFIYKDINGNVLFELCLNEDGKVFAVGNEKVDTGYTVNNGEYLTYFELDLDNRKAKIVMNGKDVGVFDMSNKAADLSEMTITTQKEAVVTVTVSEVHMYVNYTVMDMFRMDAVNAAPYGWEVSNGVVVGTIKSDHDFNSVKIPGKGSASKTFDKVSGKFVYETFVKVDDKQSASAEIKLGDKTAVKIDVADGKITSGGVAVRDYTKGIWQLLRVEGDTNTGKAVIKVNNKKCLEVDLPVDGIDTIVITANGEGDFWFDDVEVYNVYDYSDYVPTPVPVTDDEWYVGMSVCSLWREGSHFGWDCISPYYDASPLMGYYDEGLPEVADWEIKFMVEHGIDFQHFCWYTGGLTESIKESRLSDALNDGFLNAKYSDMQDFMIMWENGSTPQRSAEEFKNVVWNYWCDWYLSDSRYFTIDNKPVITIFIIDNFVTMCGGEDKTTELIKFMNEDVKRYGYDGIILLACHTGNDAKTNALHKKMGFDGIVAYSFGVQGYEADYQISCMDAAFEAGELTFLPCVGVGFNSVAWTESRTPNASVEEFTKVLEWSKSNYMPRIDATEAEDWMSKFVLFNTWNEYGEGHYIMPAGLNGFGYLDATRKVFSSVAGKDDSDHVDVLPTDNQRSRLSYLYPARKIDIRRTYWDEDASDNVNYDKCEVIKGWYFDKEADCKQWRVSQNCTDPVYDSSEKALVGTTTTNDGGIMNIASEASKFNARDARYLRICMKLDAGVESSMQFYFQNNTDFTFQASKGSTVNTKAGDYQYYVIDLYDNKNWNGVVDEFRIDPLQLPGKFYIKSIEFLAPGKTEGYAINVDGTDVIATEGFYKSVGNEVFFGANPSDGFFSLHRFYYEWNRWDGTLNIKTDSGKVFKFNVGSDKVLVDGAEKTIAAPIEVVDGLPMLPVKFIYDNAGIKYTLVDGGINVELRSSDVKEEVEQRVEFQWEFNVSGDNEGWGASMATGNVDNGNYTLSPITTQGGSVSHDPQMILGNLLIEAKYYKQCEIRFKPVYTSSDGDRTAVLYFATSSERAVSETKTGRFDIRSLTPDSEGYYVVKYDFSSHAKWVDQICTLRFDPSNNSGTFYIDYVRMIRDPNADAIIAAEMEAERIRNEKLAVADEGGPFYVDNPDAEGTEPLVATSSNSVLKIVEDDLNPGNHAYLIAPPNDRQVWAYFLMPTKFKPGVRYKVEFDLRVVGDSAGNELNTPQNICWNLRYTDVNKEGVFKEMMDHNSSLGMFTTADGWKKVSFEHTISMDSTFRNLDYFCIYSNPTKAADGSDVNVSYMVDNIVVTVVG